MKKLSLFLGAAALALSVSTGLVASETFTVDGIDVILKTNPGTPVVSANFALKGGLPYYGADQAGIELLMARAAQKGSKSFPKEALQTLLARTGTDIAVDAQPDYTVISMSCLKRDLGETWKAFCDIITNPTFDSAEVALVKEQQLGDVRQSKDDPDTYLRLLADQLHYASHPYAVPPMGTEASVGGLDAATLKAYHAKAVQKARSLVVLVGDIDRATAEQMVKSGLGGLPPGQYAVPPLPQPDGVATADTKLEQRALPTNYVRGCYVAPSPEEPDYIALTVATQILRERLFEEVRTKRNMTYAVSAGLSARRDNFGMLYVTAVEPDTTLRVMINEVHKMQNEEVSEKELHDHLKVMVTDYLMDRETNASQAAELCKYEIVGSGFQEADRVVDLMRKVSRADVQRVCKTYMNGFDFVMLGDPAKWKDPLAHDAPVKSSGSLK
jgi:zinc protease